MAAALARGSRITGTDRQELAVQLGQRYADGESIRAIAGDTGRSFGFVHGLVKESGVTLRGRGGATRGAAAAASRAVALPSADQATAAQRTAPQATAQKLSAKVTKATKDKLGVSAPAGDAAVKGTKSTKGKKVKGGKSAKAGKGTKTKS